MRGVIKAWMVNANKDTLTACALDLASLLLTSLDGHRYRSVGIHV